MSKIEFDDDADPLTISNQNEDIIGIVDDAAASDGAEYAITTNEDGIVAYRIVHIPDHAKIESTSELDINISDETTSATANSSVLSSQCQYFVIENSNGYLQAVQTPNTSTIAPTGSNSLKARSSVTIAPKTLKLESVPYSLGTIQSTVKTTNSNTQPISTFKKRDDRRRATHNEVERRRRDKINHWIMKLGSIIPADGTGVEIGQSGRISIAAVEGQSKGGILSKACEYIQMLQEKQVESGNINSNSPIDNKLAYEKKKCEDEIVRLRGDNEFLKALLIKHGINYAKERNSFKSEETL